MQDETGDRRQMPPATELPATETPRKRYETPSVTIYGNLPQITGVVGRTGASDGGTGKRTRTSP